MWGASKILARKRPKEDCQERSGICRNVGEHSNWDAAGIGEDDGGNKENDGHGQLKRA